MRRTLLQGIPTHKNPMCLTTQIGMVTVRFHLDETGDVVALGYSNPVLREVRLTRLSDRTSPR
jgi:hypothetical protein